jgi:hypothetical protein
MQPVPLLHAGSDANLVTGTQVSPTQLAATHTPGGAVQSPTTAHDESPWARVPTGASDCLQPARTIKSEIATRKPSFIMKTLGHRNTDFSL